MRFVPYDHQIQGGVVDETGGGNGIVEWTQTCYGFQWGGQFELLGYLLGCLDGSRQTAVPNLGGRD